MLTKYVVIVGDGMADYPIKELGLKTPLQYAATPNLDQLARCGMMGMVCTVPPGFAPGSDVANLSVMGYDPVLYYTGRSPLEAVSMGVELEETDVAFRCNLVTLSEEPLYRDKTMVDYSADEISTSEASELVQQVNEVLGDSAFRFYSGVSYRHLMTWRQGTVDFCLTPPHDIFNLRISDYLPEGEQGGNLLALMEESSKFLKEHPVNKNRVAKGLRPANSIWLWGQGRKPALPVFFQKYRLSGSVISAVDLTRGLGICAGLEIIDVPGATGNIHTNFSGKAEAGVHELLRGKDFVYIHVEAPDEASHRGELENKIKAIEQIDEKVVGGILRGLEGTDDFRLLIMPDHFTPLHLRTHVSDAVPFLIYQKSAAKASKRITGYSEEMARHSGLLITEGHRLMDLLVEG